jgi:hypothetical protein
MYLRPVPDDIYTLQIRYQAKDSAPADTGTTNLWLTYAADLLLAETGVVVASMHLQDDSLTAAMMKAAVEAKARLLVRHETRRMETLDRGKGD